MSPITTSADPLFIAYVLAFAIAAGACAVVLPRARRIDSTDTRNGLVGLLATTAGWAASHVGYLVISDPVLKEASYLVGLVLGIAAVWAWLYFASAYTGRIYHRHTTIRRAAVVVFGLITLIKVTNPFHGQYYIAEMTSEPFHHLMISHSPLHWTTMGLAYALAFVGIFLLLELFMQVRHETRPLILLLFLTAVPVILDVGAHIHGDLLEMTYSALGVAVFAVGVLVLYERRFEHVHLAGTRDDPVIVLDTENHVLEHNAAAESIFPTLMNSRGRPIEDVLPEVDTIDATEQPLGVEVDGQRRYYDLSIAELTAGSVGLSKLLTVSDVTHRERYRRELERQNERLERFASMVSHDLRNPLTVAIGHLELASESVEHESLAEAEQALVRMESLIDDLLTLARHGQPIDDTELTDICAVATDAWNFVETGEATMECSVSMTLETDPDRLQQLFENLFRNAIEHGGEGVMVRVVPLDGRAGFAIEDTGPGIDPAVQDDLFEAGVTTSADGTGFGMSIVTEIVNAHQWSIAATEASTGGARFEITV